MYYRSYISEKNVKSKTNNQCTLEEIHYRSKKNYLNNLPKHNDSKVKEKYHKKLLELSNSIANKNKYHQRASRGLIRLPPENKKVLDPDKIAVEDLKQAAQQSTQLMKEKLGIIQWTGKGRQIELKITNFKPGKKIENDGFYVVGGSPQHTVSDSEDSDTSNSSYDSDEYHRNSYEERRNKRRDKYGANHGNNNNGKNRRERDSEKELCLRFSEFGNCPE
ncbi:unnamed protein product, partial [Diamesa hyperborea]